MAKKSAQKLNRIFGTYFRLIVIVIFVLLAIGAVLATLSALSKTTDNRSHAATRKLFTAPPQLQPAPLGSPIESCSKEMQCLDGNIAVRVGGKCKCPPRGL